MFKKEYEKLFFKNLDEDYQKFKDQMNINSINFSKLAKIRATLWYLVSYFPFDFRKLNLSESDPLYFICNQIASNNFFRTIHKDFHGRYIGMAWFIIGDVLIEIKKEKLGIGFKNNNNNN